MPINYKERTSNINNALAPVLVCKRTDHMIEVLNVSAGLCRLLSAPRNKICEYFQEAPLQDMFHPDDLVRVLRFMQQSFQDPDTLQQYSYRMLIPWQKQYLWLMSAVYGYRLPDGSILQYITSLDITKEQEQREEQEEAFEQTSILLEKILDTTKTALFWKDSHRRFLGANKAFLDYYEFPSEHVILGKTDEDMGWHENDEPFRSDELRVLQTGESTYRVHGKCMSHGEMRDIVASKSPLIQNGKIVGLVGSFEDVTDEIRRQEQTTILNEQLRQALERAEAANRAKSAFLSNVSHDMRTPLNGILGIAELASKCSDTEQLHDYIEKILTAGSLLKDLINDTLELSRIGSNKKQLVYEDVNAAHMLDNLIETLRCAAEQKAVIFHVDLDLAAAGTVRVDKLKLSKILLNLLTNAVKFTPSGKDVWLKGRVHSCKADSCTLQFQIRDNGIGISQEFIPRIFDPFEQENALSQQSKQGTGLGLSIAKDLLTVMGGTINVESEKGKGTTFMVEVPVECTQEEIPQAPSDDYSDISLEGRQILICEDNELNLEIISTILKMNQLQVLTAENGAQGVEKFVESPEYSIEAILMDIRMPEMDGLEATRMIRRLDRPDARKIPILALSANAFQEDMEESRKAGMNDHLTKPIEPAILLKALKQHIGSYEAFRKDNANESA